MPSFPFKTFLAALLASSCFVPVAQAATITWDGGASTTSWFDAANWSGNAVPMSADETRIDTSGVTASTSDANTAQLHVGYSGTGTLTVNNGGEVASTGNVYAGSNVGSTGTINVTGADSTLTSGGAIVIGHSGTGTLTVSNGASVTSASGYNFYVGWANSGNLSVSSGGTVSTYWFAVGAGASVSSAFTITDSLSTLTSSTYVVAGNYGQGSANILNGALVSGRYGLIGNAGGSTGQVLVSGLGSMWNSTSYMVVGNAGTGTLTVSASGAVSATGNVTIANQSGSTGTLNIGAAAGDAAAAAGTVSAGTGLVFGAGDGTLVFNHTSNDYDFDLDISNNAAGTATIKAVAGTTNLTGDLSDYTGDFQITGGTLNLASSLGTTTLAGSITGAGALSFLSGTTNLTGDSSAFTGTVSAGGIVSVNGSLGGTVNVLSGGTLMGSGTVNDANIQSGGAVAPGNSIGTLNVAGDVAFAAGSTYEVEIDATTSDKIEATGTATLNGGDVVLTPYNGASVTAGTSYTILSAAGGLLGTGFDSVSLASNSLFLGAALRSDANNVYANITQTRSFASVAATDNQAAAANAAETLGGGNAVYAAIALQSDVSVVRTAFTTLAGEIHANARAAVWEDQAEQSRMLAGRLARNEKTNIWAQGIGAWGHRKGDGNAEGFKRESKGVMLGADGPVTKNIKLGGAMGYSHGDLRQDTAAKGQKDSYSLHVYGGYGLGKLNLRAGAGYGWHEINTQRTVTIGSTYTGNPKASYHAQTAQGFAEAAYGIGDKDATLEPFANLTYGYTRTSGFTEKGGAAALTAGSQGQSLGLSTLGARVRTSLPFIIRSPSLKGGCKDCNEQANFEGTLGWQHLIGGRNPSRDMAFASTPAAAFTTSGAPMARDALAVGVSATYDFANDMSLGVAYQGRLAPDDSSHAVTGRVGVRF